MYEGRFRRFPVNLPALLVGNVLVIFVCVVEIGWQWHWGAVVSLVLPMLGCLIYT
jgi:hypothetical protein